jgi:MtN3 and saliva related transmembrane protein
MEIIGIIAGLLTLLTYVPQAFKTIKTQQTRDLSLVTLLFLSAGAFFWVLYGLLGKLPAVWITNIVVLALGLIILVIKLKNGRK